MQRTPGQYPCPTLMPTFSKTTCYPLTSLSTVWFLFHRTSAETHVHIQELSLGATHSGRHSSLSRPLLWPHFCIQQEKHREYGKFWGGCTSTSNLLRRGHQRTWFFGPIPDKKFDPSWGVWESAPLAGFSCLSLSSPALPFLDSSLELGDVTWHS